MIMISVLEIMKFPGLGQGASANEIIVGFSEAFLAIIVLAVVTKCILTLVGELSEGAATTSFLDVIRRAFQ